MAYVNVGRHAAGGPVSGEAGECGGQGRQGHEPHCLPSRGSNREGQTTQATRLAAVLSRQFSRLLINLLRLRRRAALEALNEGE
jgi:hypothetical protein